MSTGCPDANGRRSHGRAAGDEDAAGAVGSRMVVERAIGTAALLPGGGHRDARTTARARFTRARA
ncbi:hypothetical protein ABT173_45850, partial [Streptomyces sp. NPDC001795]|uniref:hypothetical protein n=1 Tax=Streptomyces sp. NPDC001795 TaxID=3154525 RepID=UPI0033174030